MTIEHATKNAKFTGGIFIGCKGGTSTLKPSSVQTFTSPGKEFFRILKNGRIERDGVDITDDAEALAEGIRQYAKAIVRD